MQQYAHIHVTLRILETLGVAAGKEHHKIPEDTILTKPERRTAIKSIGTWQLWDPKALLLGDSGNHTSRAADVAIFDERYCRHRPDRNNILGKLHCVPSVRASWIPYLYELSPYWPILASFPTTLPHIHPPNSLPDTNPEPEQVPSISSLREQ